MMLFSMYAIFGNVIFETSILVMFLSQRGVGYSHIMSLFSIMAFCVIILEYLTGVLADKYSRKWTLFLSTGTFILAEAVFVLGNNFYIFIAGIILMAVSVASKSGADMAYLYDKLLEAGKEDKFEDIASSLGSIGFIISSLSCIAGSFMAKVNICIPFISTIAFSMVSLIAIIFFKEPSITRKEKSVNSIVKSSFKSISGNKKVLGYVILSIIIFPSFHVLDKLFQPYLKTNGVKLEYFGIFYTMISVFQSLGTLLSNWLAKKYKHEPVLIGSTVLILSGFILMSVHSPLIKYFIPMVMGIGFGMYYNQNNILMNKNIGSNVRASVLSLQHAMTKLVQIGIFSGIGFIISGTPISTVFLAYSVLLGICLSAFLYLWSRANPVEVYGRSC
jgi:MFS family permease